MPENQTTVSTPSAPSDQPRLEFRIPVSPADTDMRMVRYFLDSIRLSGGPIARAARTVLSVGDKTPPFDLHTKYPWLNAHNVDIHWVKPAHFEAWEYNATGFDRFWIESDADVVAKIDADLLITGDFDDVVRRAHHNQTILGLMAHVSPFGMRNLDGRPSAEWWADIYRAADVEMPELTFQYSGWGLDFDAMPWRRDNQVLATDPAHRYGPAYFNAGVVIGPRAHFDLMGTTIVEDIERVDRFMKSIYSYQIAHPVCCDRHGLTCETISINDNFPMNLPTDQIRALNPVPGTQNRHEDTRIFHYIGQRKFFETPEAVQSLIENETLQTRLESAWPVFQARLSEVHAMISAQDQP